MTNQPKPDSPELRAISSTYLSEGAEVGYMLAVDYIRSLERQLADEKVKSSRNMAGWTDSVIALARATRQNVALREAALQLEDDLDGTAFRDRQDNDAHDLDSLRELMRAVRKAAGEKP